MALQAIETVATTMAPGQALELAPAFVQTREAVECVHERKTASVFGPLGRLVASCVGASSDVTEIVADFTTRLGRAYQIIEDMADRDDVG